MTTLQPTATFYPPVSPTYGASGGYGASWPYAGPLAQPVADVWSPTGAAAPTATEPLAMLPPPEQQFPALFAQQNQPATWAQSVPIQVAQPVQIPGLEPPPGGITDIPPPNMVAPWVFTPFPRGGNYFYNNYNYPGVNNQFQAQPPVMQQPPMPPAPPQQPPAQPPGASNLKRQEKPPEAPQKPETPPKPATDPVSLTGEMVKRWNDALDGRGNTTVADQMAAAEEIFEFMSANPQVEDNPQGKEIMNAFVVKLLKSDDPTIRMFGLLVLQEGLVKSPKANVRNAVKQLVTKGVYDEPGLAQGLLKNWNKITSPGYKPKPPGGSTAGEDNPDPLAMFNQGKTGDIPLGPAPDAAMTPDVNAGPVDPITGETAPTGAQTGNPPVDPLNENAAPGASPLETARGVSPAPDTQAANNQASTQGAVVPMNSGARQLQPQQGALVANGGSFAPQQTTYGNQFTQAATATPTPYPIAAGGQATSYPGYQTRFQGVAPVAGNRLNIVSSANGGTRYATREVKS